MVEKTHPRFVFRFPGDVGCRVARHQSALLRPDKHMTQRTDQLIRVHPPMISAFEVVVFECENVFLGDRIGRTVSKSAVPLPQQKRLLPRSRGLLVAQNVFLLITLNELFQCELGGLALNLDGGPGRSFLTNRINPGASLRLRGARSVASFSNAEVVQSAECFLAFFQRPIRLSKPVLHEKRLATLGADPEAETRKVLVPVDVGSAQPLRRQAGLS